MILLCIILFLKLSIGFQLHDQSSMSPIILYANKYNRFSTGKIDPLIEAMEREKKINLGKRIEYRGTTVPVGASIPQLGRNSSREFGSFSTIIPSDPYTFGYSKIGVISGTHGVKGELKLQTESDAVLQPGDIIYIKKPTRLTPRPIKIASIRYTTDDVYLLGLDQIVDRDIAEKFKNYLVYIRNDKRPDLADDEFLIRDLVGLNCSYQGVNIAAVVGVVLPVDLCDSASLASKMHSLLEIRIHSNKQLCLLPFVPSIVPRVDMKLKIVWIEPPDGLLDLTYEEKVRVVIRGYLPAVATMSAESRKWFETLNTASQICIADSRSRDLESSKAVAAPSTIKRKRTVPSLLAAKRKSLRTPTSSSS